MIFVICKCSPFNILRMNKKDIEEALEDPESFGWIPSDNLHFKYMRRSKCGVCDENVYFADGYTKDSVYNAGTRCIAKSLQGKLPSSKMR